MQFSILRPLWCGASTCAGLLRPALTLTIALAACAASANCNELCSISHAQETIELNFVDSVILLVQFDVKMDKNMRKMGSICGESGSICRKTAGKSVVLVQFALLLGSIHAFCGQKHTKYRQLQLASSFGILYIGTYIKKLRYVSRGTKVSYG